MLVLVLSLLMCACANGLVGKATKAAHTPLMYETYVDAGRYLFNPAPNNWTEASKVCRTYNGHLAFPKTQDEADALWTIMTRYNVQQVHAGFHDQFVEGEYYTAKGRLITETSFNKWSSGFPLGGAALNCGGLRGDGFVDVACPESLPSICEEYDPSEVIGGFLDYEFIPKHGYFKFFKEEISWSDAMKPCYSQGSHLWIPNSPEEQVAVLAKFNITVNWRLYWVGIHQFHASLYFVTIFDDTLESTGYNTWTVTAPNANNTVFPYVVMTTEGYSTARESTQPFICEYNRTS